jgi:integrase
MPNGHGSVYLRGNLWTIGFTINGRRVREGVSTNKRMAEMVLAKRMSEAIEGRYFNKRNVGRMPFSEFAEKYLKEVVPLMRSVRSESIRVRRWVRDLGSKPLGQITRAELETWQREARLKCKPATVNRELGRLRHMFNRAVDWGMLEESPMNGLKFLRENNARQRYLSLDECERLIQACISLRVQTIVVIALHTGMRMGEILSIRHRDLDFRSGLILIPDSKNGEPRHIPMDSTVASLLAGYHRHPSSELVFANKAGGRFLEVRQGFKNACKRAGISDLHFHDLRHSFASHWMMTGGEIYALKEILGHKSILMTQRYAHLSPAFKRAAINRMDNIWKVGAATTPVPQVGHSDPPPVTVRSQDQNPATPILPEPPRDAGSDIAV